MGCAHIDDVNRSPHHTALRPQFGIFLIMRGCSRRAMMKAQILDRNNPLFEALELIDPSGTLVPGTEEHDKVSYMLQGWIDQNGPDQALCMARLGATHLDRWRKFL
jgi:hypothetical protein